MACLLLIPICMALGKSTPRFCFVFFVQSFKVFLISASFNQVYTLLGVRRIHLKISEQISKPDFNNFFHTDPVLVRISDFQTEWENPDEIGTVEHLSLNPK